MRLYGKSSITEPVEAMNKSGRFVHSYIITGDKGTGRKTAAKYIAMSLMCDNGNACGECRQCRRILKNQHPDFIMVKREKDSKNYSVKDIREKVVSDSYVYPNDCDRKVYVLYDCEGWMDAAQDALLKITEDPPDTAYFIFTAQNRGSFLPTLISRSMVMDVHEADFDSCLAALRERFADGDIDDERLADAAVSFCGNIGKCIDYLEGNEKLMKSVEIVRAAADAIIADNEYELAVALHKIGNDRNEMRDVLEMLGRVIRDAAVIKNGGDPIGCAANKSAAMAERISDSRLTAMYDAVGTASYRCTRNCNVEAAAAVLSGKLLERNI